MDKLEKFLEIGGIKKDITLLCISGASLILSLVNIPLPFDAAWIAIILCGVPIILEAVIGLVTQFDIKADALVSLALIASVFIGEIFAAGEVAFIMQLGGLLEELTVAKARAGIEKLVSLTPQTARVISGNDEKIIPAEDVKVNDILRVLPGETVPVDGVIISGQTSINQAIITGESLPVEKSVGDEVSSGTVNRYGTFEMKATKVGEDSTVRQMIKLVQSADAGKAKIVRLADRWATWIVIIALTAAFFTFVISKEIIRSVTILVVFCPCALALATPTAIMATIGNATKHGFLVREGDALERLAQVKMITFDKTGTLTYGTPAVIKNVIFDKSISEESFYDILASTEFPSEHPLRKAVVSGYKKQIGKSIESPESFSMLPGLGVISEVHGKTVIAGNEKLLEKNNIALSQKAKECAKEYTLKGCTVIYVGADNKLIGISILSDALRKESPEMIKNIEQIGITPVLLTGDNEAAAKSISRQVGISEYYARCLPEDKMNKIELYENNNEPVCMIGDGINDAPALKRASVGIAMGKIGSDIAADAADIALVDDEIKELPHLLKLSKRMMITIKCNLTFSMTLNVAAILLAITGILNPVAGALVHNAGSVFVIINSALLLKWRENK